jgi:imidazolonepropionase
MSRITLVRGARQLVTVAGAPVPRRGSQMNNVTVISDGALLIVDGRIEQVGPTRRVERLSRAHDAEVIDATGHVIIPGFVDCHTRLLCGPLRWTDESFQEAREATCRIVRSYSAQRLELEGRRRIRQFVRTGTTTLEGACGYGLDDSTELKALRVLRSLDNRPVGVAASYFGGAFCPKEFEHSPGQYLEWISRELLPEIASRGLTRSLQISDEFPAPALEALAHRATALGFAVHLHTATGSGAHLPLASWRGLEAASDVSRLARAPMLVLTPGVNFRRGDGRYAPARQLVDAGAALALATGYDHLTCPTSSIPMILSIACTQMRLTPAEALTAVTINAAAALGLAAEIGSLEVGKRADLLIMNCGDYRDIPICFGMNLIGSVMRAGEQIYPMVEAL